MTKILSKIVLFIVVTLLVFVLCIALVGCQPNGIVNYQQYSNKYNAVMYSTSKDWILTSFLEDNKVKVHITKTLIILKVRMIQSINIIMMKRLRNIEHLLLIIKIHTILFLRKMR